MPVVLARVDDRLIHAQVVEGWLKNIGADHIVVVSDEVASDEIQKTIYLLSVPYGMKVSCLSVKDAIEKLKSGAFSNDFVLLLMPSLEEAYHLVVGGVEIKSFNVGGLHAKAGKKFYTPTISLSEKDFEYIDKLISAGIELETRVLPMDERRDIRKVIDKK